MTKEEFVLMMLRAALTGKQLHGTPMPSDAYKAAMETANKQCVNGMVAQVLMDKKNGVSLSKYDAVDSFTTYNEMADRNRVVNSEMKALCELLNSHNIRFVVMKGQTISCLYRDPLSRCSGDIDFYLDEANFEMAKSVIASTWNVEYEVGEDLHLAFNHNTVEFEMHYQLLTFASSSVQASFDKMIRKSKVSYRKVNDFEVPVFEPEVEIIYTFLHLWHHFIEIGVGLRQFCDLWVLLANLNYNSDKLKHLLSEIDYTFAFRAVGSVLIDKMQFNPLSFPYELDKSDRKCQEDILEIVFERGNFGKYGRKHKVRSGIGYYFETLKLKLDHYFKFYSLAPKENRAILWSMPLRIKKAIF